MKPERFARLRQLLLQAADLPEKELEAYLDQACGDDPKLRREAELILAHGAESSAVFQQASDIPQLVVEPLGQAPPSQAVPAEIGGYRIIRKLGEGGMGVVYEAEQEGPRRRVALKVVRGGAYLDEQRVRLFRREVQALGRLKHPGIAAIHESGCTKGGEHFFVMELVSGVPLDQYLAENPIRPEHVRTDIRARLELFRQICHGINYAHQRGVIHRDLKPSNILVVSEEEGTGKGSTGSSVQVKILDFGLARITDADVSMTTMMTEVGKIQGTLSYMSPEQARGNPDEIDVRSDVYSLGVILYEMLTGELPYDVHRTMVHDAVRVILEQPPRRPSTLIRTLRGDVETIVLKALDKNPERRYQGAAALDEDVERYLADQPILARPPSTMYQLRKLVARHRALFGALAAVFVVLAGGFVFSTFMYLRAEQRRSEAEAVTIFLSETVAGVDPFFGQGSEVTILEMLDRAEEKIEEAFSGQPRVEATLRATIGNMYRALGQYPSAEAHLETALAIRNQRFGEEHPDTVQSMLYLGWLYWLQGRWDEAESLQRRTLELSRRVLGEDHYDTMFSMNLLGLVYIEQGRFDEAEPHLVRALELSRRVFGGEHPYTLNFMNNLCWLYLEQDRHEEVEPLLVLALELKQRVLGEEHPLTLITMSNLGWMYFEQGRYDEAEPLFVLTYDLNRRLLGEKHYYTMYSMNDLARLYHEQGRYDEAEPLFVRSLELRRRVLGEMHPKTLVSMNNLASLYRDQGRYDEAELLFISATTKARESLPEGHWHMGNILYEKGLCLAKMERHDEAEAALVEANEILEKTFGVEHIRTTRTIEAFVELYDAWGMPEKANQWRAKLPESETETSSQQTEGASE